MNDNCNICKWNYQSYHCVDCYNYTDDIKECDKFCYYCQYIEGSEACHNCFYSTY